MIPAPPKRIVSIDQFRGYAILGMVFVNYIDRFNITPWMLQHHREGMSFNDTIAPIFIFVVGMGFRLSMLRRVEKEGLGAARRATAKRYLSLAILGFAIYQGYLWDALSDIGLGGLLALMFMDKTPKVRIAVAALFLGLYQAAFSLTPYGQYVMSSSLNGGPLGPFSWGFILLMGSVAYDFMATSDSRKVAQASCLLWGVGLSVLGWALKIEWPGVKAAWPFSQYWMTSPYPLYSTGLCFFTLLFFHYLCDVRRLRFPQLSTLGENPLVLYLAHLLLVEIVALVLPDSASLLAILIGFLCVYGACYALAFGLHHKHIIVKI